MVTSTHPPWTPPLSHPHVSLPQGIQVLEQNKSLTIALFFVEVLCMPRSHFLCHFDSTVNERNTPSVLLDEIMVASISLPLTLTFLINLFCSSSEWRFKQVTFIALILQEGESAQ